MLKWMSGKSLQENPYLQEKIQSITLKKSSLRSVLHTWADGKGGQKIEDTGALTKAQDANAPDARR